MLGLLVVESLLCKTEWQYSMHLDETVLSLARLSKLMEDAQPEHLNGLVRHSKH
jgi:hypothetical protein